MNSQRWAEKKHFCCLVDGKKFKQVFTIVTAASKIKFAVQA